MKKLVYILNSYSHQSDQHYFHVVKLLEEIANNGVQVALVIEKCEDLPKLTVANIEVYGVPDKISKFRRPLEVYRILKHLYSNGFRKIFTRISKSGIITSIIFSFFNSNVETYYWHSGTVFEFNRRIKSKISLLRDDLEFWFIKTFVKVFVTGPESMKQYYRDVAAVREDKILILYNDIDLSRFDTNSFKSRDQIIRNLGLDVQEKVILFVHRLSPVRETLFYLPYVLEKFYETKEFDHYQSVIIGGGGDKEKLEEILKKSPYKHRIKIMGSMPNAIIQDYYSVADIFINPTMAEGFPRVIIEAEALGLPIVSTDAGGIRDIVPIEQRPYIVDKNDRIAFAEHLIELARNPEIQDNLRRANKKYVARFSTQNVAEMYIKELFK